MRNSYPDGTKKNQITLTLNIDESDLNKKIYFLDNTRGKNYIENGRFVSHHHNNLRELSEDNTKIFINNKEKIFRKYFIPKEKGKYKIKIIFSVIITNCVYMFCGCDKLSTIDFSSFNSQNIKNMGYMFYNCEQLTNLDLSSFNTRDVINMDNIFTGCEKLSNIIISRKSYLKIKDEIPSSSAIVILEG